jgi:hypothetical protein
MVAIDKRDLEFVRFRKLAYDRRVMRHMQANHGSKFWK